jgi:S1-C subfamily serine protease
MDLCFHRLRRAAAWVFLALAPLVLPASAASGQDLNEPEAPSVVARARPSVLQLVVKDAQGNETPVGNCFVVTANGRAITTRIATNTIRDTVAKAADGKTYALAAVLATDVETGLTLLKLEAKSLPAIPVGNLSEPHPGTPVVVVASPLVSGKSYSEGEASPEGGELPPKPPAHSMSMTAAVSPDFNGAPVLNRDGKLVGVALSVTNGRTYFNILIGAEAVREILKQADKAPPAPINRATLEALVRKEFPSGGAPEAGDASGIGVALIGRRVNLDGKVNNLLDVGPMGMHVTWYWENTNVLWRGVGLGRKPKNYSGVKITVECNLARDQAKHLAVGERLLLLGVVGSVNCKYDTQPILDIDKGKNRWHGPVDGLMLFINLTLRDGATAKQ